MAFRSLEGDLGHQPCGDSSYRLQRSMAVIFSKYDKDFPESDIINLEDLSISDDKGFLNRLPKEQTMWNSDLLAESNPSGLHGGPDLDVSPTDLSTTALDMFLEEVISEECQHGNITKEEESLQKEDSEDFNDDTASIASGAVSKECDDVNPVEEEGNKTSWDDERLDKVADKPVLCLEESLDKMKRVETWLQGKRKRKAISKDDRNLLNKAWESKVSNICDEDGDAALAQEWASRGVSMKENGQWQENVKTPNSGMRTPSRKHCMHGDSSAKLVTNVDALESPVSRRTTGTSYDHLESPSSRILIESWKLSLLELCNHDDLTCGSNQRLSKKQFAVSPRSSSSLVAQPYRNADAYADPCKASRSPKFSSTSDIHYTDADDDEQERSLKMNSTKDNRAYSFSQQYLQDFNKNFCKRKIDLGWIDSPNSNGVSSSTEAVNAITRGHKVIDGQLQNKRNLHCKERSVSPKHTLTLSGSDGKDSSSLNSEMNLENKQSEPLNSFSEKFQADISDTRCKTLSPPNKQAGLKGCCVHNGSPDLQTSPSYEYTEIPLLENSFEEEELPSSFVPCHSSTMINSTPLAASHEYTLEAENQVDSNFKRKVNKHKVRSKHHPAKGSAVVGKEGVITGRVVKNASPVRHRESYPRFTNPLSTTVERANSTDRHFVNKEDLFNPSHSKKVINKACKLPSGNSCGGPGNCKKVFCLDCCHSPCA